jgi:hypothetical protein
VALQLLDVVIGISELPERDEIVARIRALNGQTDPNEEQTPEQAAAREEKARKERQMEELQLRDLLSTIFEREAKTEQTRAEIEKTKVDSQKAAVDTGAVLLGAPEAAGPADELLASAGFAGADIPEPEKIAAPQQPVGNEVATNGIG